MPTATYTPLQTITLSSSASSVTFASIPQTYRDLVLVAQHQHGTTSTSAAIRMNGITSSDYSQVVMAGDGTTISGSGTSPFFYYTEFNSLSNTDLSGVIQFMDYSAIDKQKSVLLRTASTRTSGDRVVIAKAGRLATTAAINEIEVFMRSGTFNSGSTFSLYGIEA